MNTPRYAHAGSSPDSKTWHPLDAHLQAVAGLAERFARAFGAGDWGRAAGLLHDAGKALAEFQEYLRLSAEGKGRRGSVVHAVHGAKLAEEHNMALGKLLAYVIAGHHGGLPDWDGLERRLAEPLDTDGLAELADFSCFPQGFPFRTLAGEGDNRPGFAFSFFARMIFSCLVDADWLDTEAFFDPEKSTWRTGYPDIASLAGRFFPLLSELTHKAEDTPVNRIRREVLAACLAAAEQPPGLFSLTVPTGGGKTLSSLAFALRHAAKHGLSRIVYVIPYMSIIEQNADVFREFLGDEAVVEHHSSVDPGTDGEEEDPARRRAELATENWDAPLVATTAVQFFESLFSAKPARCRKLHNLANSVIILDEAQMLPRMLLLPCLAAIRELAARYGASVVLCTATQPAIETRADFPQGLAGVREIMPDPTALHGQLRRVRVEHLGVLGDAALAGRLLGHGQVLCIVNTRRHARALFEHLRAAGAHGLVHLSANMTAAHRSAVIEKIKEALKIKRPCRVVSTQLVEAGVDLDFPVVYRAAAGLDSVAQAAGRCDREGRLTQAAGSPAGRVYVFVPEDGLPPGEFRTTAGTAAEVLRQGYADLLSPEAVERYFRLLFWQAGPELDKKDILKRLEAGARAFEFPFREVDGLFRVIENDMRPLVVARDDETKKLVRDLPFSPTPGRILRRLQRHTVQLHPQAWTDLVNKGAARLVLDGLAVLENLDLYNGELGLCPEDPTYMSIERGIV